MAIYTRDNINYGGMLGNAMQARANQIQRDYDNYMKQPLAWANAVNQTGQTINDAFKLAAQYSHDDSKLAAQQQFQAEQNAKNLAEQLNRAREQQAWQARQNDLQRESTERIAELNRNKTLEYQQNEKQAQNVMHYEIAKGALESISDEIMRTDDPSKLATLYRQRDEQLAKMQYYGASLPDTYPGVSRTSDSFAALGFTPGMGKKPEPQPTQAEQPTSVTPVETVANRMAGLVTAGKAATKSADIQSAINELSALDTSKLNDAQRSELQSNIATLKANLDKAKKAEARYAEGMKKYNAANSALEKSLIADEYGLKI